jgi:hypothetical protein
VNPQTLKGEILTQAEPVQIPDFFLVGAPRCGTTAFSRYLSRNPQICFSRPKEPHYFARIDHLPDTYELSRDYMEPCFDHRAASHRVLGEGSVSYLYLPASIERILHFNPDAKFIVQLRNPLTMLPSYHLRMRYLLQEDQTDFAKAWQLQADRAQGAKVPKHCLDHRLVMYAEVASFGAQLDMLFKLARREQVHVIIFDDIVDDTLAVYRDLLVFLGVDYDGQTDFERRLGSQIYRYRWLQKLFFVPATSNGKVVDTLQRRKRKYNPDGSKRKSLLKRLVNLNKVPQKSTPLTPQMRKIVSHALQADNQHLSGLLGRDLSHWLDN